MRPILFAAFALCLGAAIHPAQAELIWRPAHAVYVEKSHVPGLRPVRLLEPAGKMSPGDRVVLVLDWRSPAKPGGFTLTSPVPKALSYERSSNGMEEISVDGGRNWGRLGALTIRDPEGARLATPEDVTHVRWRIPAQAAARGSGRIAYSAIVR
ncbi:hypothetical protein U8326_05285 [Tsuneonella sp. CC-YZS046]|uniref:hypothetical protein n=1 Tax=Tsuneonella sp. CC-YZS046 TaxID=3042152 RepID=UPI002D78EC28|nr:hypothetical protein [Tsuneonella sp. CC-YZS046]WRO67575.1 hypothetical protein U8326_05285 [Tsuneonella sp. CC-YZS046]